MSQYSMQEAESQLAELARRAVAGEDVLIKGEQGPMLRLIPVTAEPKPVQRKPGGGKGELIWMAPDFDETLEGFEDFV
jgi:antitoxin (DNA-binding transcriptional repressor) of toxin-antitoxin stability system